MLGEYKYGELLFLKGLSLFSFVKVSCVTISQSNSQLCWKIQFEIENSNEPLHSKCQLQEAKREGTINMRAPKV